MSIYDFGPFRVDAQRRLLLREGTRVRLPAKAFEILIVLLEENGRLVEKDELLRRVWPDVVVEENNLTVNISALRKALTESPGEHRYIITVPGRGYQFVAEVRPHADEPLRQNGHEERPKDVELNLEPEEKTFAAGQFNDSGLRTHQLSNSQNITGEIKRNRRNLLLLLAALVVTISAVTYLAYSRHIAGASKAGLSSIAVLPFENKTGDPTADYLSDGISESLINSLSQLSGVKVIARSSTVKYKSTDIDLQEVAKTLGVEAILTGRVTQRGENLSISVELMNANDKTQMWGQHYDRKMSDLLTIQREIAGEIAEKLKLKVTGAEKGTDRHYTDNSDAYQLYLKGRFYWNKRTAKGFEKSIEYFNQAIDKDPGFALAYAGLADSYVLPANQIPPQEAMPKAKAAAMKALELDETLAEAHVSLGRVRAAYDWDWQGAEKEYKRAIDLNPRYATAHQWYGGYLSVIGRTDEAIAERKRALELEPLSLIINFELGLAYYHARNYDQAIEQFKKTLELDQNFPAPHNFLPAAYEQKGMYSEAIAEFEKSIPSTAGSEWSLSKAGLGHLYAITGRQSDARTMLDELRQTSKHEYVPATSIALIYAGLGEKDQAFVWLDKAFDQRAFQLQWLRLEPRWDSLRSDRRFNDLLQRVGFPN